MAGPWFVDPENGSTTNNGLSANAPWKLLPGQTGASSQTGYGVVAGDTIYVRNGTSTDLQIAASASDLKYIGYGMATNVLYINVPVPGYAFMVYPMKVVREAGVHEGQWTIKNCTSTVCVSTGTRSGIVLEDVLIEGNAAQTGNLVNCASSSQVTNGVVLRRFQLSKGESAAVGAYSTSITLEQGKISYPKGDGIILSASSANGFRAGSFDRIQDVEIVEPGGNLVDGDGIFLQQNTSRFEARVDIRRIYIRKSLPTRQAIYIPDATGGITVKDFNFQGATPEARVNFGLDNIKGKVTVENGFVTGSSGSNALFRFHMTSGTNLMLSGSELQINNVVLDAPINNGFLTLGSSTASVTWDGRIILRGCYGNGSNQQAFSFSGTVSLHPGGSTTVGANAFFLMENCCFSTTSAVPTVVLPAGKQNNANFTVRNNVFGPSATFNFSGGSAVNLTAFQAAHNAATGNITASDFKMDSRYRLKPGSPLLSVGFFSGTYFRDAAGMERPRPPSVGPYDVASTVLT